MSKQANQSKTWEFEVEQLQMKHPATGQIIHGLYGNFRKDTGACLGSTSEHYGIIQNTALVQTAIAALERRGMTDYSFSPMVTDNGRRFYGRFDFVNRQLANAVGDIFGYRLTLQNSFDRTLRAAFQLGFLRLACTNGMTTLEKEFSVTRKHSTRISEDFVGEAIDHALENGQHALKIFDSLAQIGLTDEQGVNVIENFVKDSVLSGILGESIKTLWLAPRREEDKARNLYNLYNAITEHLTHRVESERFEYAGKVSNNVLFRLVNASRQREKFAKLIIPVPRGGTVVVSPQEMGADVLDVESTVVPA